ncbi:MAG TPA: HlyD family secretion protein [bacterium]|nr:HlyD family secretion protein [bacterium]
MSAVSNSGNDKKSPPNRMRYAVPLLLMLLGCGAYGVYWLVVARGTVYTDDAVLKTILTPCSSRVGGRVTEFLVKEGDTVGPGKVLARLEDMPYSAQRDQAAAGVDAAQAELESARLNLLKARISLDKNVAMAQADLRAASSKEEYSRKMKKRLNNLAGLAATEEIDRADTGWDASDAMLDAARQKLGLLTTSGAGDGDTARAPAELAILILQNQVDMAEANLALAQARLAMAEDNLAQTTVSATVGGQISRRHVDPGQVVAPGQSIFSISEMSAPWIEANFKEGQLADIEPGDRVTFTVDAYPGRKFAGQVVSVLGAALSEFSLLPAGATSGNFIKVTQRVPVYIAIDGNDHPPFYPGLNVEVRIHLHTAPAAAAR